MKKGHWIVLAGLVLAVAALFVLYGEQGVAEDPDPYQSYGDNYQDCLRNGPIAVIHCIEFWCCQCGCAPEEACCPCPAPACECASGCCECEDGISEERIAEAEAERAMLRGAPPANLTLNAEPGGDPPIIDFGEGFLDCLAINGDKGGNWEECKRYWCTNCGCPDGEMCCPCGNCDPACISCCEE